MGKGSPLWASRSSHLAQACSAACHSAQASPVLRGAPCAPAPIPIPFLCRPLSGILLHGMRRSILWPWYSSMLPALTQVQHSASFHHLPLVISDLSARLQCRAGTLKVAHKTHTQGPDGHRTFLAGSGTRFCDGWCKVRPPRSPALVGETGELREGLCSRKSHPQHISTYLSRRGGTSGRWRGGSSAHCRSFRRTWHKLCPGCGCIQP